jgi:hypothetical protein
MQLENHGGRMLPELSKTEVLRYSSHLILPEVGLQGSKNSKQLLYRDRHRRAWFACSPVSGCGRGRVASASLITM